MFGISSRINSQMIGSFNIKVALGIGRIKNLGTVSIRYSSIWDCLLLGFLPVVLLDFRFKIEENNFLAF